MKDQARVKTMLARKRGVLLDISLGGQPQANSLSVRPSGGDVTADPRRLRFTRGMPTGSAHTAVVTHVLEYLDPADWFAWWDELHRVMRPGGVVYLSGPFGGDDSQGWLADPTHRIRVVEETFAWLDPMTPLYGLHKECGRQQPMPWRVLSRARVPVPYYSISYNVTLETRKP